MPATLRKYCAFPYILYRQRTSSILTVLCICSVSLYLLNIRHSPPGNENALTYDAPPLGPFDCAALIRQDEFASSNAETYSTLHPHVSLPNGEYAKNLCQNCDEFRKRGRYISMNNVTKEEKDFPLAYSIVLYKEPDQVENLLRAIYRPHNYYCIHVDKSSDPLILSDMEAIAKCLPNVYIASRIIDVQWGQFSETEAELICMKDLLKYKKWKYFINLTGQEYPLKTNLQIVRIAKAFKGANDIAGVRGNYDFRTKFRYVNFRRMGLKPPSPHNITVSKGSIHITASRGYVEFLIMDRRSQDFINWVRDTRNPDETLFSTMNHNPHLRVPGSFNGTDIHKKPLISRFKLWKNINPNSCHGKWLRSVCVFGHDDLKQLTNSPKLFANKFEQGFMPMTLRCLSEWHYNRTRDEYDGKYVFSAKAYEKQRHVLLRIQ
ncbi:beta-1,3-galactosyl-O-glycosyl-glycoprotein beta-1,6-N-acetylglucosaminyltransferase-like [Octopus vulgaris]|uniref:Beta-1,3-galactosyl-O-glycosyl-glycoprotein beta-1,6-N-acetylglucosaminyltransferase-like n=2 Tax=Octopus TaxID=6643 RepID=A0AA36B595_OCTVU|nr:N-acetyllactosaminide beta-1,6-N-acetylglucosaminyl-transferase-like [Octopus sinensis]CAI9727854.1 beta-1,3-galactosyl-O-glycosyl-glycoprotein beta-1,6-N-acetylglucosaminyltransferase-like [Octopus vulgaris]